MYVIRENYCFFVNLKFSFLFFRLGFPLFLNFETFFFIQTLQIIDIARIFEIS